MDGTVSSRIQGGYLLSLAESGQLVSHSAPIDRGMMLPTIPQVLGDDALVGEDSPE